MSRNRRNWRVNRVRKKEKSRNLKMQNSRKLKISRKPKQIKKSNL